MYPGVEDASQVVAFHHSVEITALPVDRDGERPQDLVRLCDAFLEGILVAGRQGAIQVLCRLRNFGMVVEFAFGVPVVLEVLADERFDLSPLGFGEGFSDAAELKHWLQARSRI